MSVALVKPQHEVGLRLTDPGSGQIHHHQGDDETYDSGSSSVHVKRHRDKRAFPHHLARRPPYHQSHPRDHAKQREKQAGERVKISYE